MIQHTNSESPTPEEGRTKMPWWWTGSGELPPLRTPDFLLPEEEKSRGDKKRGSLPEASKSKAPKNK